MGRRSREVVTGGHSVSRRYVRFESKELSVPGNGYVTLTLPIDVRDGEEAVCIRTISTNSQSHYVLGGFGITNNNEAMVRIIRVTSGGNMTLVVTGYAVVMKV